MQSTLKTNKIFILADDRERNSKVSEYLKEFGAIVNFKRIEVGDFLISEDVCIERKEVNDFISSIIDGRLFRQVEEMKKCYKKVLLIIEGIKNNERITENAYKGAIASLIINYDVSVIIVENEKEVARMIYFLAKKEQDEFKKSVCIKKKKNIENISELQQFFLSSLPGVSRIISKRMLQKFGRIRDIVNASENELKSVKGLKKKDAKTIYQIFNEKFCE
ncbi:MAG: ERCC4 domain-containing protein [Candidatus Aenigmatarchaeota archaeon]